LLELRFSLCCIQFQFRLRFFFRSNSSAEPPTITSGRRCALHDALNSDWRKNAVKVCVIIADAPPHGIGNDGDGFPNGCPCGHDPLKIAKQMAENNIIIYSVAVEPNLGNYKNGRAFYKGIAKTTHGRYLGLGQAHLLPDVIVGGSAEELDLKKNRRRN